MSGVFSFVSWRSCWKKLEPILRRTLKTNADSAGRNYLTGGYGFALPRLPFRPQESGEECGRRFGIAQNFFESPTISVYELIK